MASLSEAILGMAVFLLPWVLSTPKETEAIEIDRLLRPRSQNMFVRRFMVRCNGLFGG